MILFPYLYRGTKWYRYQGMRRISTVIGLPRTYPPVLPRTFGGNRMGGADNDGTKDEGEQRMTDSKQTHSTPTTNLLEAIEECNQILRNI